MFFLVNPTGSKNKSLFLFGGAEQSKNEPNKMKRKLSIFQYGSQVDPAGPTRYSPSDWIDISVSESSPSERSCSIGAPPVSNSSISDDGEVTSASGEVLLRISRSWSGVWRKSQDDQSERAGEKRKR
nr:cytochrome c biogenesis C mitochondrion [Ipomoea trifida]